MIPPAFFTSSMAFKVADFAGWSVRESEPTCRIFVLFKSSMSKSASVSWVSAPGFLQKEKWRSPFASSDTKARVVCCFSVVRIPLTSTFKSARVARKSSPKESQPVIPTNAAFPPSFATAQAQLAGAPPGFSS